MFLQFLINHGAEVDSRYSPPIKIKGTIKSIKHGDKYAETPQILIQNWLIKALEMLVIITE